MGGCHYCGEMRKDGRMELCSGRWRISAICFGRLLLRWTRARNRPLEQVADRSVNELELRDELGGDFPVAVVGQMGLMQLTLQSNDAATKGISFSDKALNCARGGEEQFNVL